MGFYNNSPGMVPLETAAPPADNSQPAADDSAAMPLASPAQNGGLASIPENIAALRKGTLYDPALTFRHDLHLTSPELPPEAAETAGAELRRMAGDIGLSSPELRDVVAVAKGIDRSPPDEATEDRWRSEATHELSHRYGPQAHEALTLARALVARDPRMGAVLESLNLGNHPRVVMLLAERAYAERKAGRL